MARVGIAEQLHGGRQGRRIATEAVGLFLLVDQGLPEPELRPPGRKNRCQLAIRKIRSEVGRQHAPAARIAPISTSVVVTESSLPHSAVGVDGSLWTQHHNAALTRIWARRGTRPRASAARSVVPHAAMPGETAGTPF